MNQELSKHLEEIELRLLRELSYNDIKDDNYKSINIRNFFRQSNLSTIQKIREMIEGNRQDVVEDKADPFFSEPRAYNRAIDDILSQLTVEDEEGIKATVYGIPVAEIHEHGCPAGDTGDGCNCSHKEENEKYQLSVEDEK